MGYSHPKVQDMMQNSVHREGFLHTISPQTNGICERFHRAIQEEFYSVAFRKKIYRSIEEIQTDLNNWMWYYNNERTHSGKYCYGKTPMQTFLDSKSIAKEKVLEKVMQQQNILTFGSQETIEINHKKEI